MLNKLVEEIMSTKNCSRKRATRLARKQFILENT